MPFVIIFIAIFYIFYFLDDSNLETLSEDNYVRIHSSRMTEPESPQALLQTDFLFAKDLDFYQEMLLSDALHFEDIVYDLDFALLNIDPELSEMVVYILQKHIQSDTDKVKDYLLSFAERKKSVLEKLHSEDTDVSSAAFSVLSATLADDPDVASYLSQELEI